VRKAQKLQKGTRRKRRSCPRTQKGLRQLPLLASSSSTCFPHFAEVVEVPKKTQCAEKFLRGNQTNHQYGHGGH